jgi:hypothetical protein
VARGPRRLMVHGGPRGSAPVLLTGIRRSGGYDSSVVVGSSWGVVGGDSSSSAGLGGDVEATDLAGNGVEVWRQMELGALMLRGSTHLYDCMGMERRPCRSLPVVTWGQQGGELRPVTVASGA